MQFYVGNKSKLRSRNKNLLWNSDLKLISRCCVGNAFDETHKMKNVSWFEIAVDWILMASPLYLSHSTRAEIACTRGTTRQGNARQVDTCSHYAKTGTWSKAWKPDENVLQSMWFLVPSLDRVLCSFRSRCSQMFSKSINRHSWAEKRIHWSNENETLNFCSLNRNVSYSKLKLKAEIFLTSLDFSISIFSQNSRLKPKPNHLLFVWLCFFKLNCLARDNNQENNCKPKLDTLSCKF